MTIRLHIDGQARTLTDIRSFRTEHDLPETFGVNHFEPKDYTELGTLENAGSNLTRLRQRVLDAIPRRAELLDLFDLPGHVASAFERGLHKINDEVGLRQSEINFARSNFEDILRTISFDVVRANRTREQPSTFAAIYHEWLFQTVRVSSKAHRYNVHDDEWLVQIINHAFGRVGLRVRISDQTTYVFDPSLACPAEGFTVGLLRTACHHIQARYTRQTAGSTT